MFSTISCSKFLSCTSTKTHRNHIIDSFKPCLSSAKYLSTGRSGKGPLVYNRRQKPFGHLKDNDERHILLKFSPMRLSCTSYHPAVLETNFLASCPWKSSGRHLLILKEFLLILLAINLYDIFTFCSRVESVPSLFSKWRLKS